MGCFLPSEILDLIVDHLYDGLITLKKCCVVSKSWIPRTRNHLFADIKLNDAKSHIELWKKAFPDPSNSPAHHTRSLTFHGLLIVTAADTDVGVWVRPFCSVVHLQLESLIWKDRWVHLAPFHGLSSTVRSLYLDSTPLEVFDLVCPFPLLEDLAMIHPRAGDIDRWIPPSTAAASNRTWASAQGVCVKQPRPGEGRSLEAGLQDCVPGLGAGVRSVIGRSPSLSLKKGRYCSAGTGCRLKLTIKD